jgi:hypothetical protein
LPRGDVDCNGLFLGNVMHGGLSYWGTLPLGILVSLLLAGASAGRSRS